MSDTDRASEPADAAITAATADSTDGPTPRLAVVGAGAAGAGAAYALRDADVAVTVFEKSGGVCGRAATRRRNGCRYDHGANYVTEVDDRTAVLLSTLGSEGLVEIDESVWTFDSGGEIAPGDRESTKRTWREGITQLGKRLFDRADATVHRRTRIAEISAEGGDDESRADATAGGRDGGPDAATRWTLVDGDGGESGPFDALLLTPPAPQTADLLRATDWDDSRLPALVDAVDAVPYRTIRTVVLHYPFRQPYPWYGLVNADREHAIGWLSREECKPGHVPEGESLLVVQLSPAWSTRTYDEPLAGIEGEVRERVADLLGDERYRDPDWTDDQGWRYALPDAAVDGDAVRSAEDAGLFFAGDWVVGEGRVPAAIWNGHEAGERIGAALD